jgi:hypothetical protein
MLDYSVALLVNPAHEGDPKKAYAFLQSRGTLAIDEIADHMVAHGCSYDRGDIIAILVKLVSCSKELMLDGYRIQLGDLGRFYLTCQSTGASSLEKFTAANIRSINVAQKLSEVSNQYNLELLSVIGDESVNTLPDFRQAEFMSHCDSLRESLISAKMMPLTDSVVYAYSAYMLTYLELNDVLLSDFIDTRTWYFDRLQPQFNRLNSYIDVLNEAIYDDLKKNSETFQRGFYRSIIPGAVAVMVGLLLILMLLFFILAYYVNPIYKMLSGLNNYRSFNKKYTYTFEGDDQLAELNEGTTELTNENQQLRKRISDIRSKNSN